MLTRDTRNTQKRFIFSIALTSLILVAEVIGGIWSGSLALLSDAAHVFSDIFALGLSFFALRLAARPPDDRHSYGWHRAEVIAALINGASLLVIAVGIWIEAVDRWRSPVEIKSTEMMIIAVIGLAVNIVVALVLGSHDHDHDHQHEHSDQKKPARNLNVHSAYLHVLGDLISSVGVIAAALLIRFTGARWIDPFISILIGVIILVSAYRVLRRSLHILTEGVPDGLSMREIHRSITSLPEIEAVHDLHVWNLGAEQVALSAHIILQPGGLTQQALVMETVKSVLSTRFGIGHTTLQFEETHCGEGHGGCN
ncbi:MAG TPA: cation diffusion facilitator family transporter [Anaerolineaceae bacterium]|nr:cation diffusion facilitator family transporter [Anaerolineaceae bacterium]